jgi:hypothetical protein
MKFLVPNYSCLQNPWLGGCRSPIPVLSSTEFVEPPPPKKKRKIPGYATGCRVYGPVTPKTFFSVNLAVFLGTAREASAWKFALLCFDKDKRYAGVTRGDTNLLCTLFCNAGFSACRTVGLWSRPAVWVWVWVWVSVTYCVFKPPGWFPRTLVYTLRHWKRPYILELHTKTWPTRVFWNVAAAVASFKL